MNCVVVFITLTDFDFSRDVRTRGSGGNRGGGANELEVRYGWLERR